MPKSLFERFIAPLFIVILFSLGLTLTGAPVPSGGGNTQVSYLDVGQGDSALIKTKNGKVMLIDGGPDKKILEELGRELGPAQRVIDAVVLTHPHADHLAGLNYVLDRFTVKRIYLSGAVHTTPDYLELLNKIKEHQISAEKLHSEKQFALDEVSLRALWPPENYSFQDTDDLNQTSIVLEATVYGQKYLFLGDLPEAEQLEILKNEKLGPVKVLKVSHHGSKTGSPVEFLEAVNPEYAVISVGRGNRFNHPAPSTLAKLSAQKVLRTDELGTITFLIGENDIRLR